MDHEDILFRMMTMLSFIFLLIDNTVLNKNDIVFLTFVCYGIRFSIFYKFFYNKTPSTGLSGKGGYHCSNNEVR